MVLAFSGLGWMLWLGATQLADIVSMLPRYQENIHRKIEAMQSPAGSALVKATDTMTTLAQELSRPRAAKEPSAPPSGLKPGKTKKAPSPQHRSDAPVPVEVVQHQPGMVESIGFVGVSLAHFAELIGGVLIFTLFMLMQRSDLRNRLFRLFGNGHLNLMTTALDDAARRVSKYLLTQSLVNGSFGLLLGLGLYFIGVPNAPFWGVLGAVLRFVPYIGSLISGLCPLVLALAVFEGWTRPLMTFGLFATIEIVISSAVEPWLYGAHTGLSSLAILVSAAFWTLLWGPIGLILSTPLTVCLLVIGRYVPSLSSLSILLGDEPVLPPEACYYQRLLAGDDDEAQDISEKYLKEHQLVDLYDSVLIPALSLAEQDRHDDILDEERAEFIYQSTRSLIEDLETQGPENQGSDKASDKENHEPASEQFVSHVTPLSIVCMPARDKADELVGLMLQHVLKGSGHTVEVIPIGPLEEMFDALRRRSPDILFVSALPPLALSHARSVVRRVRRTIVNAKIIVCAWNSPAEKLKIEERWAKDTYDLIILDLKEAEAQIQLLAESRELPKSSMSLQTEPV